MPRESATDSERTPRRLRFSLRTFLLVVVGLCVGVGYYHTSRRLREAERELRALRDEVGYLSVEDRTQLHAISIDTDEPNTWRWRLFVPKGHRYSWNIACENIPQNDVPQKPGVSAISNEPYWETHNEVLVTARLRRIDDANSQLSVQSRIGNSRWQMSDASLRIPNDKLRWMSEISSVDGRVIGSRGTVVRDPKGPIILLQRRPYERQPDGTYEPSPNPMPGFMVWLQEL